MRVRLTRVSAHATTGPPVPFHVKPGSWVADPNRVQAGHDHDAPLDTATTCFSRSTSCSIGRTRRARRHPLRRDTPDVADRQAWVFGWSYRTLQGHLEIGEMHYQARLGRGVTRETSSFASTPSRRRLPPGRCGSDSASGSSAASSTAFDHGACRRTRRLTESQLELPERSPAKGRRRGFRPQPRSTWLGPVRPLPCLGGSTARRRCPRPGAHCGARGSGGAGRRSSGCRRSSRSLPACTPSGRNRG